MNFHNRVRMSTPTTGTGTLTLGTAQAGYCSFAEANVANGERVTYSIEDGNNFEVGRGIYNSAGPTLSRLQILLSKASGQAADTSPINLTGSAKVFLTAAGEDLRDLGPHFSVKSYGATGDGSTADHTAIQAAVDAAEASLFIKRVYLPDPAVAYVFSATVTIPAGVTVFGDNMKGLELSRCKPAPGFTAPLFESDDYGVSRVLRIGLTGLFIDGSSTTLTAIRVNAQESVFRDLTIKNCFTYGLHLGGISSASDEQALNNQIRDNYFAGTIGTTEFFDGLFIDYFSADNTITGNYIEASKDAGIRSRGYNNRITNNHIYSVAGTGGGVGCGIYTETSADHDISQNYVELCAAEGVLVAGGGSDVATLAATISGNVFRNIDTGNTSNGVIEISGSDVSGVTVYGNVVRRDAATSYATPYFVYFNGITPTRAKVFGNEWQTSLITTAETNIALPLATDLSVVNLIQTGYTDLAEIAEPSSPAANVIRMFSRALGSVTRPAFKDENGNVFDILQLGNVKNYGAKGDGSTDDTTAIQNAVNSSPYVYFPAPSAYYRTTSPITASGTRKLEGDGKLVSRVVADHSGRVFSFEDINTYGLRIIDLAIEGNGSSTGLYIASTLEETAHLALESVRIYNHDRGVDGVDTFGVFDSSWIKVDFLSCTTWGINLSGSQNCFVGCSWRLCGRGVSVDNQSGDASIGGGTFLGCTWIGCTFDLVINTPVARPLSCFGCWFEQTATLTVGNTEGGEVNFLSLGFKNCLFQPAATATLGGIMSAFSYKGTVSFEECVVFTDLYASAAIPNESSEDANSFVRRKGCISIDGSGAVSKLANSGIYGTTTNDNAIAGDVGQLISSNVAVGSAVGLTTNVPANVTSISLPPGDWDVWGSVWFTPAATTNVSHYRGAINTTSAALPTEPGGGAQYKVILASGQVPNDTFGGPVGTVRLSLNAATTVYLVASGTFTVSTLAAYGIIAARRRR